VLLGDDLLCRRSDEVAVIGSALIAHAAGAGHRPIADRLGVPASTVRGWLRRFRSRAGVIAAFFTTWALALAPGSDPPAPTASVFADAVEAVGMATRAAVVRVGVESGGAVVRRGVVVQHELPLVDAELSGQRHGLLSR
jgi:hypothetical protein